MSLRDRCRVCCAVLLAGLLAAPALAAGQTFGGEFDPFPHDNSTRDNVVGAGTISATLAGSQLAIRGDFSGLSSLAVGAHLRMGAAMGVPGPVIGELTVTKGESGQVSGTVKLDAASVTALNRSALYVELDSTKAPDGNSWAWLEPQKVDTP